MSDIKDTLLRVLFPLCTDIVGETFLAGESGCIPRSGLAPRVVSRLWQLRVCRHRGRAPAGGWGGCRHGNPTKPAWLRVSFLKNIAIPSAKARTVQVPAKYLNESKSSLFSQKILSFSVYLITMTTDFSNKIRISIGKFLSAFALDLSNWL